MKNLIFVLAVLFAFPIIPAFGDEITILGNNYKIPKIYEEHDTPRGILVDITNYIDGQMKDYTFNISLYPWMRAYKMALRSKGGLIGLSKTQERLEIFDYSDVVYFDEVIIVVMKGHEFDFENIEDLKDKIIGIGRGGSFGDEYEKAKKEGLFKVEEDNGPVLRLRELLAKRIDCALISPGIFALNETIKKHKSLMNNKAEFVVLSKPFMRDPNFLGFHKKMAMQGFLKEFNAALKQGYETGEINRIIDKYSK